MIYNIIQIYFEILITFYKTVLYILSKCMSRLIVFYKYMVNFKYFTFLWEHFFIAIVFLMHFRLNMVFIKHVFTYIFVLLKKKLSFSLRNRQNNETIYQLQIHLRRAIKFLFYCITLIFVYDFGYLNYHWNNILINLYCV